MAGFNFGNVIDYIGTAAKLPEFGVSELINGGKNTVNTGGAGGRNSGQGSVLGAVENAVRNNSVSSPSPSVAGPNTQNLPGQVISATTARTPVAAPTGGAAAPTYPDKSNDIALQMAGLGGIDQQYNSGLAAVQKALDTILGRYSTEAQSNEANYQTQADTNKNNQQRAQQAALIAAAQGRRGLLGVLSSIGALSGSGVLKANQAVQAGANADISGANDTFGENQAGLDTNIATFRNADKMRREDAVTAAEDAKSGVRNQAEAGRQKAYVQLANNYAEMGNMAEAKRYTDMAAALFPAIAQSSIPSTNLAYTPSAFTPTTLANYVGGDGGAQVSTTPAVGTQMPGLIATMQPRRRDERTI